jgi:hypothetical protein
MADIAAFIRAQLDEDERVARAAEATEMGPWLTLFETALAAEGQSEDVRRAIGQHVARFIPERMLWDIEAKRAILAEVFAYEAKIDGEWGCCHTAEQIAAGKCPEIRPDEIPALRLLALPYAGKPGYQEEWRP